MMFTVTLTLKRLKDFWSRIDCSDVNGCWLWKGSTGGAGYGQFCVNGKSEYTHRISFALAYLGFPKELEICHDCDVHLCCNPTHAYMGSHQRNLTDRTFRRRERPTKGTQRANAKLDDDKVREIRRCMNNGEMQKTVAARFGIPYQQVQNIMKGKKWAHVSTW